MSSRWIFYRPGNVKKTLENGPDNSKCIAKLDSFAGYIQVLRNFLAVGATLTTATEHSDRMTI